MLVPVRRSTGAWKETASAMAPAVILTCPAAEDVEERTPRWATRGLHATWTPRSQVAYALEGRSPSKIGLQDELVFPEGYDHMLGCR